MLSKGDIKNIRRLHQKKYRDEEKLFIAEGPKVVNELLGSRYPLKELFAIPSYTAGRPGIPIRIIREEELHAITALSAPNQVLGIFQIPDEKPVPLSAFRNKLVLALDDIRDPGNLGTIIRIADWFGIAHVFCSENCVEVFNPKTVQAAMGSLARVEVRHVDLPGFLSDFRKQCGDAEVYAAVVQGENIYPASLSGQGILLIGNESRGISKEALRFATRKISVPSFGKADSLNAAIATAVICSEFKRREHNIPPA